MSDYHQFGWVHVSIHTLFTSCLLQLKEHKVFPGCFCTLSSTDDCGNSQFFELHPTPQRLPVEPKFHSVLYISNTIIYSVLFSPRVECLKCFSKVPQFGWTTLPFMPFFYFKLSLSDEERRVSESWTDRAGTVSGVRTESRLVIRISLPNIEAKVELQRRKATVLCTLILYLFTETLKSAASTSCLE